MKVYMEKHAWLWVAVLLGMFSITAWLFAYHQNIWVDESTQMSGLSLPLIDIYRWLGGLLENPFPVPSDRMPVLSYWLGSLWSQLFGLDVLTMRWMSLTLVVASLLILSVYFLKRQQPWVLFPALAFLCLSANLTVNAIEIRAYALFFFFSVVAVLMYLDILSALEQGRSIDKKIIGLAVILLLAINTHFFGVVLSGAILGTYLLTSIFDRRVMMKWRYFIWVALILCIAMSFIVLPVLASFTSQDGGKASGSLIKPAIKLVYRLVSHQSMGEVFLFPYLALVLVYGVIIVSLFTRLSLVKVSLVLMLGLGFLAVFLANILLSSFDALAPHYNIWMLVVLAVLFGYCVVDLPLPKAVVVMLALFVLLGTGQYTLAVSGDKYAHTRFDQVQSRVAHYQSQGRVGVLYNKAMAKTWFAGRYYFPRSVNQYIVSDKRYTDLGDDIAISGGAIQEANDIIIVVFGRNVFSGDLNVGAAMSTLPSDSPVHSQAAFLGDGWELLDTAKYLAQESAEILVYKKTP